MQNEEKNNGVQPQLGGTPEVDIESAETGSYQSVEHPSRPRKDKARLHATRHGINLELRFSATPTELNFCLKDLMVRRQLCDSKTS